MRQGGQAVSLGWGIRTARCGHNNNGSAHDFGLAAVGARGRHLDALDVLEVNPLQSLQAMAAHSSLTTGAPCRKDRVG